MVSPNVNKILLEAQTLSDMEREELLRLLALRTSPQPDELMTQTQLREALVARGLLETKSPQGKDAERYRRWRPVRVKGKPLSQTLIEERR